MLPFGDSFLAWIAATVVPVFIGFVLITGAGRRVKPRYLAGFALGIFFWFFVDTIGGSADLYVNAGFGGGVSQFAIILLFAVGLLVLLTMDKGIFSTSIPQSVLALSLLAAVAVGIHGLGEGTAFGSTAALTSSTSIFETFGGLNAVTAYILHKLLEPMMVGAIYMAYKTTNGPSGWLRDVLVLTLVFSLPSFIGAATGYYIEYDATYFFALGTGTSVYAALRLARPLFVSSETAGRNESLKVALALLVGFIFIYIAALFHS